MIIKVHLGEPVLGTEEMLKALEPPEPGEEAQPPVVFVHWVGVVRLLP